LQGADLGSTQLQGADFAQLQYAFSQFRIMKKFSTAKLEKTSLIGLDNKVLDQEEIDEIMLLLTNKFISENRLKQIKQRLQRAIGKDIIQWVKSQRGINLGILTEDEFNKIANSITEPKARKRMGLPPLKKP
ncbi:MAG: hypothetical protein KAH22_11080, partial [Thiotrichaceae bacterium]|nr:hypothetical protein [Thiotrichaceae bacterium]